MDWNGCDLVEVVPGKVSGVPLIKGTRIPADFVLEDFQRGSSAAEIQADFPRLTEDVIVRLLQFADEHQSASAA